MFILEKPYVSEYLADTLVMNEWPILDNDIVESTGMEEGAFNLCSERAAINYYLSQEYPLIYSNSESAISWILKNLPRSNLSKYITLFKDKIAFRDLLKEIFPNFYYETIDCDDIRTIKADQIKFPVVLKPSVGFLSLILNERRYIDPIPTVLTPTFS